MTLKRQNNDLPDGFMALNQVKHILKILETKTMPKMEVTQADGSSEITEDETHRHTPVIPKFNHYQPRVITLRIILKALKFTDGETIDKLSKST